MSQAPVLYQETRVSTTPTRPAEILSINTTSDKQQIPGFGAGRKRGFGEISGLDEESYARKYLATEGSVFFRRKSRFPRSFLWRVLEDRKVLEIQSVDLVHDKPEKSESWLTFRIVLANEIVQNGVAFADSDGNDALEAFVLTSSNELYTITLKRDLLTRESAPTDFDAKTCFKRYTSNSLAFRHPYRLVAVSSLELLISLNDGGLMRLERQPKQNGSQWRETFFSEGGWSGTLRGLIPLKRHRTIRYGNIELEPNAVAAMAKSPDGKYIWTVSLDYELKAWSGQTGRKVAEIDLFHQRLEISNGKQQPRFLMAAEQGTLLQIVTLPSKPNERSVAKRDVDSRYFIVLHLPKDHQFKIYQVMTTPSSDGDDTIGFEDLQGGGTLIPPIDELLNTNIWHLEEFHVQPGVEWQDSQIWLRARSGTLCRTFTLTFDLFDDGEPVDLAIPWQSGWTVVDTGMQTVEAIRASMGFPGDLENIADSETTPSEKWLDFILQPARFSTGSIETALYIYRKGRGLTTSSGAKGLNAPELPLEERITQAVTSKIILRRLPNEQPDYAKYQSDIHAQWKTLFSLLSHLHNRRNESIGFAFDSAAQLPWTIRADFVAPIRASSHIERLCLNDHLLSDDKLRSLEASVAEEIFPDDNAVHMSQLMAAARDFNGRLSADFREKFRDHVLEKAIAHESGDQQENREQVEALYEVHNISLEVMDDDFQALEDAVDTLGGLGNLTADAVFAVLEMTLEEPANRRRDEKILNRYGDKFIVAVAQETLERDRATLLDMLTLVVFMYGDLEPNELHEQFVAQIGELYDAIMTRIKHGEMLSWLASNEVPEPPQHRRSLNSSDSRGNESATVPLLERIAIGDWDPKSTGRESLPELLTKWSKQWIYAANLFDEWDGITSYILAFLIKEQYYELATDFQKFIVQGENSSSWSSYLEGRLFITTGDYAHASLKFRDAAEDMAQARYIATADTAYLLSDDEKNYFGAGQSAFFQHIAALFEKLKIFSYTADFARLALDYLESGGDAERLREVDRMSTSTDSPDLHRFGAMMEGARLSQNFAGTHDELRSRLFNALVQTGRFRGAFDALEGIEHLPMKKSDLSKLLETCVKQDAVQEMLDLPFEEAKLAQEPDTILLSLAKKGLASGSTGSPPYHQILYAFRTQRSDFRGASEILYEHLERLRHNYRKHGMRDPEDETLLHAYVLLINTMACCGEEDAWLLADSIEDVHGAGQKRKLVQIADVRREYGAELDERSDILQGRFPLVAGDEMDVL
ncbi:hypothetical protein LTR37_018870 [Vermiconidia calcicola]|uniref:Uncharacterized protein n=1 Tax=Vermiconidia calcicola TaxID=1690605 RepID=A0ACC3MGW2_9PEZI|nr:hypothetical protein LTR37_018870 [Vermiconidia calcicola]